MKEERPLIRYEKLSKEDLVDYCRVYWRRIHNDEVLFNEIYEDIESLKEENKKLKEEVEQLKNQRIFNSAEYDLITLSSTTPKWELRRK